MASVNKLLSSWNFDNLTGSDGSGQFIVSDVIGDSFGAGHSFSTSSTTFLLKEDILTNKKLNIDTIEGSESIQTLEEDDRRIDLIHKPSSLKLILENSMYQVISDEMMHLFSSISGYTFKFSEPADRYSDSYSKLDTTRHEFFSKIVDNPNLEKYIEFYKWIDSSLGYMLDQLKPENSNNVQGLKNTVESHILERNKYKYQLPLTVQSNKTHEISIAVTNTDSLSRSAIDPYLTATIENIVSVENETVSGNYKKNYEIVQTAGKIINNRGNKRNKTVFQTRFSSVDGLSDTDRDDSGEYSVYNGLNLRASEQKVVFNYSQSLPLGTQGELTATDFRDNNFVVRNIPYKDENYHHTNSVGYQNIPSPETEFLHYTNILVDINSGTYEDSKDIVEPCVQFNVPLKLNIQLSTGLQAVETLSPYSSLLDTFSIRNRLKYDGLLDRTFLKEYGIWSLDRQTFFWKAYDLLSNNFLTIQRLERLEIVFPRTDLIGLARVRTKTRYEEEQGYLVNYRTWSENSYNNNSSQIRTFWRANSNDRKRTRGADLNYAGSPFLTGALNCYNYPNMLQDKIDGMNNIYYNPNIYNSVWSMDCRVNFQYATQDNTASLMCTSERYGDLAPYSHFYQSRFYLAGTDSIQNLHLQPKPQFIHNLFFDRTNISDENLQFVFNLSYQSGLDCNINPFYNTYEDFRKNIKHKTQTRSIVPEYITSRFDSLINDNTDQTEFYDCDNYVSRH